MTTTNPSILDHAVEHFTRLGATILDRGYETRFGVIDLVLLEEETRTLVFVTVRSKGVRVGQKQTRRRAACYLAESDRPRARELRFDLVSVSLDNRGRLNALEHLEGAL